MSKPYKLKVVAHNIVVYKSNMIPNISNVCDNEKEDIIYLVNGLLNNLHRDYPEAEFIATATNGKSTVELKIGGK